MCDNLTSSIKMLFIIHSRVLLDEKWLFCFYKVGGWVEEGRRNWEGGGEGRGEQESCLTIFTIAIMAQPGFNSLILLKLSW